MAIPFHREMRIGAYILKQKLDGAVPLAECLDSQHIRSESAPSSGAGIGALVAIAGLR